MDAPPTLEAAELRRRFAERLATCGAEGPEIAAALEDLERAFEIASTWSAEAAAATAAEAAAIAAYGDDNMAMDADTTGESDWTNGIEPEDAKRR